MASVPDVSNCTEKPEPTSNVVNGRRSERLGRKCAKHLQIDLVGADDAMSLTLRLGAAHWL
ncbi:hypothetical protein [Bradyrhizobium diversitatis]|uniref:Uncharacterized protein n=1 Tax=Bradyrhizobium diversitatis TaxID=2755406 RepID=A0ABS0NZF3_9BRAD|nr:hypothetical protein [Bradyrhizobium diversitatis]MBH5386399.1 hypothetical protein [Bradyrhizobium diversitatis]